MTASKAMMEDIQAAIEANTDDSFAAAQAVMDVVLSADEAPARPVEVDGVIDPFTRDMVFAGPHDAPPSILVACLSGARP